MSAETTTASAALERSRTGYSAAVGRLAAAQKSGAGVPAYLRWVNRGLGRRAAAAAYVVKLTPNRLTALSAVLSLIALAVIAFVPVSLGWALTAMVLLLAGYALDSADGQLARLTGTGSVAGEWLDHVVDAARLPLFHLAVAVHVFREEGPLWLVGVALLFMLLASVWFFAQTLAEKLSVVAPTAENSPPWVSFVKLPWDVGLLYLIVAFIALPPVFSVVYSALFAITALVALLSFRRKYRGLMADAVRASSSVRG